MSNYRKLTQEELVAEATERFGKDPFKWAFKCPSCEDVATGQDFSEALKERPRNHTRSGAEVIASDIVGQECIGRTLGALQGPKDKWTGRGCDWVAYGLFGGPWEIALPNGATMHAFPLAEAS
ncbi:VVA0879 family protein [Streptomyces sp. NPDC058664]|uniref:VVA0879 family protein n=1 Tax=unclassified Streptomyces TaxID=2593676 RepID=UPI0036644472